MKDDQEKRIEGKVEWQTELYLAEDTTELAQALLDSGLLFVVNTTLHHFGMALGVSVKDEDIYKVNGLSLHLTGDPNGIWFDEATTEASRQKTREHGIIRNVKVDG